MEIELVAVGTVRAISLIVSTLAHTRTHTHTARIRTHARIYGVRGSKENDKLRNSLRNNESAPTYIERLPFGIRELGGSIKFRC